MYLKYWVDLNGYLKTCYFTYYLERRRSSVGLEKQKEKRTSYNKCVHIAFDFTGGNFHVDTAVETGIIHSQVADGYGVVLQRSGCLNPVFVPPSRSDFVSWPWHGVIVKHLFKLGKLLIQIHPNIPFNAAGTSCRGALQGDTLARLSVHCNVLCHKRHKLSYDKVKRQPSASFKHWLDIYGSKK